MKFFTILAVLLGPAEAAKFHRTKAKTAFCISGNVRKNHGMKESVGLKKLMDDIDPHGLHFAFVNPCESETKPWAWHYFYPGKAWQPAKCAADPWVNSSWKKVLNPTRLVEYRDKDVYPHPPPEEVCLKGKAEKWYNGVYQQFTGLRECFRLVEEYENKHNFKFETVVRMRADGCSDPGRCAQSQYCHVDKLNKSKVYLHFHDHRPSAKFPGTQGHFFDNFAIVPRKYADAFFNVIENYKTCAPGGPGEAMINYQVHKHRMVVDDMCECHNHLFCPKEGRTLRKKKKSLDEEEIIEGEITDFTQYIVENFGE